MRRRGFLATPLLSGLAAGAPAVEVKAVVAFGDSVHITPSEYSSILKDASSGLKADVYGAGGAVEQLERHMAAELGKESAIWMPTGTLANHLALRKLAGERKRVLVQAECHIYNDCADTCQTLSGLNLLPLAPGRATFTLEEAQQMHQRGSSGPVKMSIGALMIESPVRRRTGEVFDFAQMKQICAWARSESIGTHLDGARLYLGAAYSGVPVKEYSALFDTVYISMYKYFGAASGAILAGPKSLLADMVTVRRMFGGGQNQAWPFATVALKNSQGFSERFAKAVKCSEEVIAALKGKPGLSIERISNGSNLFYLDITGQDAEKFRERAGKAGFELRAAQGGRFLVGVNESWNRATATEIVSRIEKALV